MKDIVLAHGDIVLTHGDIFYMETQKRKLVMV